MKKILILLIWLVVSDFTSGYDFNNEHHPKQLGANNWGTEFYFSFIPCLEKREIPWTQKIYVTSNVRTKVKVEVPGKDFEEIKSISPFEITEFALNPKIAMPMRKEGNQQPFPEEVIEDYAIHIVSDDPIICYALTDNISVNQSEGFIVLPVHTLGREYVVSSDLDMGYLIDEIYPSYTVISSPYDSTIVSFLLSGNELEETAGGQKSGETTHWNMNSGDILLIPSKGYLGDLNNSVISSNKPVSVVSGNYCSLFERVNKPYYNWGFIQDMEIPAETWGKTIHYIPFNMTDSETRKRVISLNSWNYGLIDYQQGILYDTAGGHTNYHIRDFPGSVYTSNNFPIYATINHVGYKSANKEVDPFQINLVSDEQFQKDIMLFTPGLKGSGRYKDNYLEICYQSDKDSIAPSSMELGIYNIDSSKFNWTPINDYIVSDITTYPSPDSKLFHCAVTAKLPEEGVFKIKSEKPFQAYSYGFSDVDGYGFPTSVGLKKLDIQDDIAPNPEWTIDCSGRVNANNDVFVNDLPEDSTNRSNISLIYLHTDKSYNYNLLLDEFVPCNSSKVKWSLEKIDSTQDALAVITFADCNGNDTTIVIESYVRNTFTNDSMMIDENIVLGQEIWKKFIIVNRSSNQWYCENYEFRLDNQGYSIWNEEQSDALEMPLTLNSNDTLTFWVKFYSDEAGIFSDSLGFGSDCDFSYQFYLWSGVGIPIIDVSDITFPDTKKNDSSQAAFTIKNIGTVELKITGFRGTKILGGDYSKIFKINNELLKGLTDENPYYLQPSNILNVDIVFSPDDTLRYTDSLIINSNSIFEDENQEDIDSICTLVGKGIEAIDVIENESRNNQIIINTKMNLIIIPENLIIEYLEIYDIYGRRRIQNNTQPRQIDISKLENGVYFININGDIYKFLKY